MSLPALLWVPLATIVFDIPLLGSPLTPPILDELRELEGIATLQADGPALHLEIEPRSMVRLSVLSETIRRHTVKTEIDYDGIPLGAHTIFEMNAGQCFNCSEGPLKQRLSRKGWIDRWSVVDYAAKGRLRFRITPRGEARLAALGRLPFEDILFTDRYDTTERVDLDWPTGSVEWRESEEEARWESSRSLKPLLIFPTAGT